MLKAVASRLSQSVREDDTISRYAGDEFMYLLTEVKDSQNLSTVAAKILESIQTPCDVTADDKTISVTVTASVGIAIFPKDGTTVDAWIYSADKAMYLAKESKNCSAFAA